MKFNSYYGTHNQVVSNSGERYQIEYEFYYDENGCEEIRECGKTGTGSTKADTSVAFWGAGRHEVK